MSEPLLVARGIEKSYGAGRDRIEVLRGLDLDLAAGEAAAVVGDSGVGKSTLLHVLGGLDRPDRGHVLHRGQDVFAAGARSLSTYRNVSVGFVFQFHHLLPEFTALENVEMPFRIGRRADDSRARARDVLEKLGLGERIDHRPSELSGGERQRVAVARAVVASPSVVLADEPTGNLDPATGRAVFELVRALQRDLDFGLVVATHSGRLAAACDRVLRLEEGRLRGLDAAESLLYFEGTGLDRPPAL